MAEHRRSEVIAGLFVTLAVVAFGAFAFQVGDLGRLAVFRGRAVRFETHFVTIQNLSPGAKVTVGGRRVGTVIGFDWTEAAFDAASIQTVDPGMAREPGSGDVRPVVRVYFDLDDPGLRVEPTTARVLLRQDGILGQFNLELDPGYWPADRSPAMLFEYAWGDEPVFLRSAESAGIDALFSAAQGAIARVDTLLETVQLAIDEPGAGNLIQQLLNDASAVASDFRKLLDETEDEGLHGSFLRPARRLLEHGNDVLGTIEKDVVARLLSRAESTLTKVDGALANVSGLLDEQAPKVGRILDGLAAGTTELRDAIATGRAILGDNRANVAESSRRLRRALWEAEMALRKIRANPAYLLYGDEEPDLREQPLDLTELRATGRARPYSQRDEGR